MGSIDDIMQLCRLCLVKDQVNIPIFDETSDIRQTFLKISQCLPVKVSRDDNLPKKICDGCSYKLDMLYVFRNTSVDSEKQLMTWLSQAGLGSCSLPQTMIKDGVTKPEIMVKQETFETTDVRLEGDNPDLNVDANEELGVDAHSYIMQQQKLPYQQDFAAFGEPSGSTNLGSEEPPPKKTKRAAATKKHVPLETEVEEALDNAMQITKAEEEDSDDVDQPDYVEAPSTSADDQPGPSGVGKGTIEAPFSEEVIIIETYEEGMKPENSVKQRSFRCRKCHQIFKCNNLLRRHRYTFHRKECLYCGATFRETSMLFLHSQEHAVDNLFPCNSCDEKFESYFQLTLHKKTIAYKDSLNSHLRIHKGERPFACEQCGKTFVKKLTLRIHQRVHTKEKPHVCELCNKKFSQRGSLTVHIKTVHYKHRRHLCPVCNKGFAVESVFNTHLKHHEKKVYKSR